MIKKISPSSNIKISIIFQQKYTCWETNRATEPNNLSSFHVEYIRVHICVHIYTCIHIRRIQEFVNR